MQLGSGPMRVCSIMCLLTPCSLDYITLFYSVNIDPRQWTTDVVVHSIAKCIVYSTAYGRHEHRHSGVFNELYFVPWPILVVIVQVGLRDQLLAKRVALLRCLPHTFSLLHSL